MSLSFKLNEQQKKAVLYTKGPLLVVAGAGTGKTFVIVEKIKHIINKKLAKPDQILALTFTEKASLEMEERVDKALPYGYFQMWISTFHSFADQILRDEIANIGLNPSFKLMSDAESIIYLRNNLFLFDLKYFRPLTSPNKFLEALLNHFSRLKDEDVSPEEYLQWAQKIQKTQKYSVEERKKYLELARSYDFYQKLKVKEGYFDFSDLIYYLLQLFRKRKSILSRYQKHFKYILVDEFQDTNIAQYELIKLLCPPLKNPNLTVVGDDSQAIYKFRGASVSNILNFMKDYPKGKLVTLKKNYRSIQPILDFSYRLIKHNDPDTLEAQLGISKKLTTQRREFITSRPIDFYFAEGVQEEADYVADEILKTHALFFHGGFKGLFEFRVAVQSRMAHETRRERATEIPRLSQLGIEIREFDDPFDETADSFQLLQKGFFAGSAGFEHFIYRIHTVESFVDIAQYDVGVLADVLLRDVDEILHLRLFERGGLRSQNRVWKFRRRFHRTQCEESRVQRREFLLEYGGFGAFRQLELEREQDRELTREVHDPIAALIELEYIFRGCARADFRRCLGCGHTFLDIFVGHALHVFADHVRIVLEPKPHEKLAVIFLKRTVI